MIECEIRQKLFALVDDKFKNFSSTIVKNNHPMIGVQIPKLGSIAKMICKGNNDVLYLNANKMEYYEEILLQGFVIGYSKINNRLKFDYLSRLIPLISDWSECDCIVNSLKFIKTELDYSFSFLIPYLNCDSQFKNRFAIVCLLNYFLTIHEAILLVNGAHNLSIPIEAKQITTDITVIKAKDSHILLCSM